MCFWGSGFGVWGLGFRVLLEEGGIGCVFFGFLAVWGLGVATADSPWKGGTWVSFGGFGVRGSGFGVRGFGFGVWGLGFRLRGLSFGVRGMGLGEENLSRYAALSAGTRTRRGVGLRV